MIEHRIEVPDFKTQNISIGHVVREGQALATQAFVNDVDRTRILGKDRRTQEDMIDFYIDAISSNRRILSTPWNSQDKESLINYLIAKRKGLEPADRAMRGGAAEAYGRPVIYQQWEDIFRIWYEQLNAASRLGIIPTFLIGGQSGAGKSTVSENFRKYLILHGKEAVIIHTNELFKKVNLKEFGTFIRNGFSLLISPNRIDFLDRTIARSKRTGVISNMVDQAKAINGQTLTFSLPGHAEIDVKKGTVIILEGSLSRSILPILIPSSGVFLEMGQVLQRERIFKRGTEKKYSFLKVFIEDRIKESGLLRGLIESRGGDYDYFIDVSSKDGPITMLRRAEEGLAASSGNRAMTVSGTYAFIMPPVMNAGALNKIAKRAADHLRDHFIQQTALWKENGLRLMFMNGGLKFKDRFDKEITLKEAIDNSVNAIADRAEETGTDYTGKISLQVTLTDQGYVLELEDNGIGMGKDILETKILNFGTSRPITKLSNNNKRIGGAGFGSRVTLKFLKDHKGVLQVETFKGQTAWILTKDYGAQTGPTIIEGQRKVPGTIVRWVIPADRAMVSVPKVVFKVLDVDDQAIIETDARQETMVSEWMGERELLRFRNKIGFVRLMDLIRGYNGFRFAEVVNELLINAIKRQPNDEKVSVMMKTFYNPQDQVMFKMTIHQKHITKHQWRMLEGNARLGASFLRSVRERMMLEENGGAGLETFMTNFANYVPARLIYELDTEGGMTTTLWAKVDSAFIRQEAIEPANRAMRAERLDQGQQMRTDFRRDAQRFKLRLVPPRIVFQRFTGLPQDERARIWDDVRTWESSDDHGGRRLFFETKDGKSRWNSEGSDAFIAFQNGKPVGALGFLLMPTLSKAWENGIFVRDEARGKGIALKLSLELFKYLKERNYKRVAYGFEESDESQGLAQRVLGQFGQILVSKGEYQDHKISLLLFDVEKYNPDEHPGGIDLTPAKMNLEVKNDAAMGIKFHLDPAMLVELRNAPGFVPVIISVEPLEDLRGFLVNK